MEIKTRLGSRNNRAYGIAVLTADATQKNGVGIGQANDGTTFDFCFGAAVQQIQYNW